MSTSVGSTMEGRRSQSYETEQNLAGMVKQFHEMLNDAIRHHNAAHTAGLEVALWFFEGYFGYFGEK